MDEEDNSLQQLPKAFVDFLEQNGLDPQVYRKIASDSTLPRYIRLKPGCEAHLAEFEAEIKLKLAQVTWLPNFYRLPHDVRIAGTKAYQQGKIYGIDASSAAAVLALDVSPGDLVLDLCAAPGAKLCMLLDLIGSSGSVTGVDIARHRLAATRTMLLKYALGDHCRLFVADGTKFSLLPSRVHADHVSGIEAAGNSKAEQNLEKFKEWTPHKPYRERKRLAKARNHSSSKMQSEDPELIYYGCDSEVVGSNKCDIYRIADEYEISESGYDKVLVDAECTHDGSVKHIQKFEQWGWSTLSRRVLDAERTDDLTVLQLKLLTNGFRLLRVGGYLVYSTCSLTVAQNEEVVEKFLSQQTFAALVDIAAAKDWPCKQARLPKTLRFDPMTSSTSGLFVAKFTKLKNLGPK